MVEVSNGSGRGDRLLCFCISSLLVTLQMLRNRQLAMDYTCVERHHCRARSKKEEGKTKKKLVLGHRATTCGVLLFFFFLFFLFLLPVTPPSHLISPFLVLFFLLFASLPPLLFLFLPQRHFTCVLCVLTNSHVFFFFFCDIILHCFAHALLSLFPFRSFLL